MDFIAYHHELSLTLTILTMKCLNTVWFIAHHWSAEVVPKDTLQTVQLSASTENIKPSHFPHYKIQYKISQYCVKVKFSFRTKSKSMESGGKDSLIPNINRWRHVYRFTPPLLSPGKGAPDTHFIGG